MTEETNYFKVNETVPTKVLVIDGDEAMIEMLKLVLESETFDIRVASSGPLGVESARRFCPDVIILDLMIPEMDGWQVCRAVREFSQASILVLSAVSKPGMIANALDEGADDYLLKPVASSVLVAHVKRLAWRARAEKEAKKKAQYNYLGV